MSTPADRTYTNARRAGRTNPDLVEVIDKDRSDRRTHGHRLPVDLESCKRPVSA